MDPFLEAHRLTRHCYAASGPAPLSIRDQYHRGVTLVERLQERDEIGVDKPLLVVGAGVAGVAAAIRSAKLGVQTYLCDKADLPFALQRRALSRHIDTCVYDWPVDHYAQGAMPPVHAPVVLNLAANMASTQAAAWTDALSDAIDEFKNQLVFRSGVAVSPRKVLRNRLNGKEWLQVQISPTEEVEVAAIIWAASQKTENTRLMSVATPPAPIFEGIWFWAADDVTTLGKQDRVLISGAGDGALQDYIRAVTGRDDVREILSLLPLPDETLRMLQSAEDRAHRGRVWLPDVAGPGTHAQNRALKQHEKRWLEPLDTLHRAEARRLVADKRLAKAIGQLLSTGRDGKPRQAPLVHLVHRTPYLTPYYGVNRFLSLLLAEYQKMGKNGTPTMFPGRSIHSISEAEAIPGPPLFPKRRSRGGYRKRFGLKHYVTFDGPAPASGIYNVIIIRHGHDRGVVHRIDRLLRSRKQLLPFFCPT